MCAMEGNVKRIKGALTVCVFGGATVYSRMVDSSFDMHWDCRVGLHWQFANS